MSAQDPGEGIHIPGIRLDEVVGRGGMGVVYRAYQERLDRWIAVKVISPGAADDPAFRTRFEHESRLAAAIEHPNVLPVYDSGEVDGRLYIAMRLIEGSDLREAIARSQGLDPERVVKIVAAVADALDTAHARGLVHRDIKPANILLARPGQPREHAYLSDFGLSKRLASAGQTKTGTVVGTVDYMAPEQWRGDRVDGRADTYALGVVLFEALTGRVPYTRESDVAKLYAHLNDPVPAPSTARPGLPPALDAVVTRAMAKDPDDRFPSAGDLGRAATAALEGMAPPGSERTVARGPAAPGAPPPPGGPPPPETGPTAPLPRGDDRTVVDRPPTLPQPPLTPLGGPPPPPPPVGAPPPSQPPSGGGRSRWPLVALLAVVLVAVGAGGAIALSGGGGDGGKPTTTVAPPTTPTQKTTDTGGVTTPPPTTPENGVAEDRDAISGLLSRYEEAYTNQSRAEMGAVLTTDASREGFGSPGCIQEGKRQILDAYQNQWDQGTGAYDLSYDPGQIKVAGDSASLKRATYSISGGASNRIDFEFERTGADWLISRIDAIFQSCS
jgi:serine/threonine protein kinase